MPLCDACSRSGVYACKHIMRHSPWSHTCILVVACMHRCDLCCLLYIAKSYAGYRAMLPCHDNRSCWSTAIYLLNICTVLHDAVQICCSKAAPDARYAQQIAYKCMLKSHVAGLDCRLFADNARSQSMPKTWSMVCLLLKRASKTALLYAFIHNSCLQPPEHSH